MEVQKTMNGVTNGPHVYGNTTVCECGCILLLCYWQVVDACQVISVCAFKQALSHSSCVCVQVCVSASRPPS